MHIVTCEQTDKFLHENSISKFKLGEQMPQFALIKY